MQEIKIDGHLIKNFGEPYVIAEIGANHNGDMDLARKMIQSAKDCGAHAAKFQSWTPKSLIAKEEYERNQSYDDSPKKHFGSLEEMVTKYYLREEQHFELKEFCKEIGITFCSSPFSREEVDLLNKLDVPFFKVASMDINNIQLLEHLAVQGKPVVISTGMANLSEIDSAVNLLHKNGCNQISLLHCISIYPPKYKDIHLNNITMLQQAFGLPVGFSDHTIGTAIPLASIALGACIIEKHFTTDKSLPGWDHEISADPAEMQIICEEGKNIYRSMGNFHRTVSKAEEEKKAKFRRSLVTTQALSKGHILSKNDLVSKRPGTGIEPSWIDQMEGRAINKDLAEDSILHWEYLK